MVILSFWSFLLQNSRYLILIEKNENKKSIGKGQNFFNAIFNEKIREGEIIPCVYIGINNEVLIAKRI